MLTTQTTIGTSWVSTAGVCGLRCVLFLAPASGFLMHLLTPRARPTLDCTTMVLACDCGLGGRDLGLGIGVAFADSNLALDRR